MQALRVWCGRPWLCVTYAIGIAMAVVTARQWEAWVPAQRLMGVLAVLLPLHVFEEDTFPGGFFYMNNLTKGSADPFVYPQNSFTNMFANLGAEVVVIVLAFQAWRIPGQVTVFVAVFGLAELVAHLSMGASMLRRLRGRGKRTVYNPGLATAALALVPLSACAVWQLARSGLTGGQLLGGLGIVAFVIVGLILTPFAINLHVRSARFAFERDEAGYFARYLG